MGERLDPETIGERLRRGEISEADAIEMMDRLVREQAMAKLNAPPGTGADAAPQSQRPVSRDLGAALVLVALAAFALAAAAIWILLRLNR